MTARNHHQSRRKFGGPSLHLDLQIVIKVLDDLGMSDAEIKRYFGNDGEVIAAIRNFSESCACAKPPSSSAVSSAQAVSRQIATD
ncbi:MULTISPECIES: hypothetical protein [unclassified Mesorhizobium]|uniref:hypothetical protein n=1 Tax=unclassified Mesorhizobium TaxID=325217 RepID=UPI0030154F80